MRGRRKGEPPSREKFLLAMDAVFVESGYAGISMRKVADRAGTGLAVVNRNWASKQELIREAFARHFDAFHAKQMAAYDQLEALAADGEAFSARQVLDAFFGPAFDDLHKRSDAEESVYCSALVERSDEARGIVLELVEPVARRTLAMLRRACPEVDEARFVLVATLIMSAYSFPLAFRRQLMAVFETGREAFDTAVTAQAISEAMAGLLVPSNRSEGRAP